VDAAVAAAEDWLRERQKEMEGMSKRGNNNYNELTIMDYKVICASCKSNDVAYRSRTQNFLCLNCMQQFPAPCPTCQSYQTAYRKGTHNFLCLYCLSIFDKPSTENIGSNNNASHTKTNVRSVSTSHSSSSAIAGPSTPKENPNFDRVSLLLVTSSPSSSLSNLPATSPVTSSTTLTQKKEEEILHGYSKTLREKYGFATAPKFAAPKRPGLQSTEKEKQDEIELDAAELAELKELRELLVSRRTAVAHPLPSAEAVVIPVAVPVAVAPVVVEEEEEEKKQQQEEKVVVVKEEVKETSHSSRGADDW